MIEILLCSNSLLWLKTSLLRCISHHLFNDSTIRLLRQLNWRMFIWCSASILPWYHSHEASSILQTPLFLISDNFLLLQQYFGHILSYNTLLISYIVHIHTIALQLLSLQSVIYFLTHWFTFSNWLIMYSHILFMITSLRIWTISHLLQNQSSEFVIHIMNNFTHTSTIKWCVWNWQ